MPFHRTRPALNREAAQLLLAEVLGLAARLHPIARKPLVDEARRRWRACGIIDPMPRIDDQERRARALAILRHQRGRKRR